MDEMEELLNDVEKKATAALLKVQSRALLNEIQRANDFFDELRNYKRLILKMDEKYNKKRQLL